MQGKAGQGDVGDEMKKCPLYPVAAAAAAAIDAKIVKAICISKERKKKNRKSSGQQNE